MLSIAATPPLCDGFVAKAVATFVAKRPGVKVNLQSLASPIVLDRVINREVDLGVVYEPVVSSAVRTDELLRAAIGCIMPAKHPLAKRATDPHARPRALSGDHLPAAGAAASAHRPRDEREGPRSTSVVETGTSATAITLAVYGAGIALVETALFSARPVPGFVTRPMEPKIELKALLLRPRQGAASKVLDDFIKHLKASMKSGSE